MAKNKTLVGLAKELEAALRFESKIAKNEKKLDEYRNRPRPNQGGRKKPTMIIQGAHEMQVCSRTEASLIAQCTVGNVCNALKKHRLTNRGYEFKNS